MAFAVGGPRVRGDDKGVWKIATFAPVRHFAKWGGGAKPYYMADWGVCDSIIGRWGGVYGWLFAKVMGRLHMKKKG